MDERQVARFLAFGRIAIGTAVVLLPSRAGRRWFGPVAQDPAAKVAIRALGVRDAALGLGVLQALSDGAPVAPWIRVGILSDAVDASASLVGARAIGAARAVPAVAIAGGAAVLGLRIATTVD